MTDIYKKTSFSDQVRDRRPESSSGFVGKFAKNSAPSENGEAEDSSKTTEFSSKYATQKGGPQQFSKSSDVMRKSRMENQWNFSEATRKSRIDCVFLVRGKDKGRAAWHYVLVDKSKREMFLAKSKTGSIDVADYGEILYSGWGEDPTEEIVNKIKDEFGS